MQRDDAEFGEALDEEAEAADGEKAKAAGGSGLPWEGDDKRDYKYEELLGEGFHASCWCQRQIARFGLPMIYAAWSAHLPGVSRCTGPGLGQENLSEGALRQ